jgi:hypothetical protein
MKYKEGWCYICGRYSYNLVYDMCESCYWAYENPEPILPPPDDYPEDLPDDSPDNQENN